MHRELFFKGKNSGIINKQCSLPHIGDFPHPVKRRVEQHVLHVLQVCAA